MKDPAFLFYSQDFLTGTMLMSDAQVGQYIRLLCLQHQKGHLGPEVFEKICGGQDPEILEKFQKANGKYYQQRLADEMAKRDKFKKMQSDKAKKRWASSENVNANEIVNENENENERQRRQLGI